MPKTRIYASALREFLSGQASAGLLLIGAALLALVLANGPFGRAYSETLSSYLGPLSLLHWINDGLMAVFFLLVGLEIKREFLDGQLSNPRRRILPGLAAAGGMAAPAIIYLLLNTGERGAPHGWAVPTATDIAFALGVLALLGPRVPVSLRIFLTALAIIDDLGAVVIIALFYSGELALGWVAAALAVVAMIYALNWLGVTRLAPYLLLGVPLWAFTLLSGIHATIAGVLLALLIPLRTSKGTPDDPNSPLHRLEHRLQFWVAYLIVPTFGLANAGVSLAGVGWSELSAPVALGTAAGLFFGKQLGVFTATWLAIRFRLADVPEDATMVQVYGVALLCGIGFTMSLFIGLLAFDNPLDHASVKLGVLTGSLVSAVCGVAVLLWAHRRV
ncbi:Na+/H+ antiporter NhaA [Altererythrobacter sp. Root672]|uniref:Na+/H+ antiporter NhaA n=1 Tax=Altererythrobacter sp. Root672 TaxID=1736584 RepID=UPI000AA68892|nr:Na+/H+ antiporter NhaA [Altererythrobacter sp. Root672]